MEIVQWCKMQIMCLLILMYIGYTYIKEGNYLNKAAKILNDDPRNLFHQLLCYADDGCIHKYGNRRNR